MAERWHILGVGAIGGLFACRLQSGGAQVTLLTSDSELSSRNLILKGKETQHFHFPQQKIAPDDTIIDHLLVCTKAWAVEAAVQAVAPRLSATSAVVLLCNGMGLAEAVTPLIGQAQLILGSTTSGCRRSSEDELIVSGQGRTQLGALDRILEPPTWLSSWQQGVPDLSWETDIRSVLLAKVALNAVINPLTAIHQASNGDLLQPPLWAITQELICEVQSLLRKACMTDIASALPERVRAVCESTSNNHSSMRVDIEKGAQTEIDAIVGWLLRDLTQSPPPTPILNELFEAVQQRDRSASPNA